MGGADVRCFSVRRVNSSLPSRLVDMHVQPYVLNHLYRGPPGIRDRFCFERIATSFSHYFRNTVILFYLALSIFLRARIHKVLASQLSCKWTN